MAKTSSYRIALKSIRLLLLDVDGVMTDGGIYYGESGEEMKKFDTRDGYGLVQLQKKGIRVGLLTGRSSRIVERRAKELGIEEVHQSLDDKAFVYEAIKSRMRLRDEQIAYIGDDEPDLPVLKSVGFSAAPADAVPTVRKFVRYVCRRKGGEGAVREVADMILAAIS